MPATFTGGRASSRAVFPADGDDRPPGQGIPSSTLSGTIISGYEGGASPVSPIMNNKRICSPLTRLTALELANAVRREQIRLLLWWTRAMSATFTGGRASSRAAPDDPEGTAPGHAPGCGLLARLVRIHFFLNRSSHANTSIIDKTQTEYDGVRNTWSPNNEECTENQEVS